MGFIEHPSSPSASDDDRAQNAVDVMIVQLLNRWWSESQFGEAGTFQMLLQSCSRAARRRRRFQGGFPMGGGSTSVRGRRRATLSFELEIPGEPYEKGGSAMF